MAGYSGDLKKKARFLMDDPEIIAALDLRNKIEGTMEKAKASRLERQNFWSAIMRNEDPYQEEGEDPSPIPLNFRLKASELLGKSETDFIEKIDMTVEHSLADIITQAYQITDRELKGEFYEIDAKGQRLSQGEASTSEEASAEEARQEEVDIDDVEDLI